MLNKKYHTENQEASAQALWEQQQTYAFDSNNSTQKLFSIDTPPPTVSGNLHIGHVFSYTHTDFIARFKRMTGHNVFYPMGFDDNGLPTERFVEKKHKTKAHILGRSKFIALCQQEVTQMHKPYTELWQRLGLSVDWKFTYSTISDRVRGLAQQSFLELLDKKLVERRALPSLFCTTCRTSVAQAELESSLEKTTFNTILFSSENGNHYEIATTRPELLPACVAVFYHPEDARFTHLNGTHLKTPYFETLVPCLPDDMVDPEKGTGLVMCCTFGDQTDIMWYQKHSLPLITIIDEDGKWNALTGPLEGLRVHDARKKILALLSDANKLIEQKHQEHHVGIHERCKQAIEFRVMRQWFVSVLDDKEQFLQRGDELSWTPESMHSRYNEWVKNLGWDWCISRQRFYGVPFPVWHCNECAAHLTPPAESLPIDPQEVAYPGQSCPQCGSTSLSPDTDVMDTWNISSLTPIIHSTNTLTNGAITLPMSLRPQAHDIIRTWAFYSIVKSHYHYNVLPWNTIAISGHVTSGNGKISKSQGGAKLTPENLLSQYGADAVRYWAAKGKLGIDTAFSEDQIKQGGRLVTKLWNAFRFISEHVQTRPTVVAVSDKLNQWLLQQIDEVIAQYSAEFSKLDHTAALEKIDTFFWHSLCDNYLELIKDRLFNPEQYSAELLNETRYTLHRVGIRVLQLYAPFVPFITEQLYQQLYAAQFNSPSIHTTTIQPTGMTHNNEAKESVSLLLHLVSEIRKQKSEAQCSLKTPICLLTIHLHDERLHTIVADLEAVICGISKAEKIHYSYEPITHATHLYDGTVLVVSVGTIER